MQKTRLPFWTRWIHDERKSICVREEIIAKLLKVTAGKSRNKRVRRQSDHDSDACEELVDNNTEFLSDVELAQVERQTLKRMRKRTMEEQARTCDFDKVVMKELSNIEQSIAEGDAYALQTNSKSPWTLKKISREIQTLRQVLFVRCNQTIDPALLYAFAERVFVGKRECFRVAFLFKFTFPN